MRLLVRFLCIVMLVAICYPVSGVIAQELRELQVSEVTGIMPVIEEPEMYLLIVESTVQNLTFESPKLFGVTPVEPGVWNVLLESGPQYVTIRADGFLPKTLQRHAYPGRRARKIRVTAFGSTGGFDISRPELRLFYSPASETEEVYIQLDNKPHQPRSFDQGVVNLRPTAGQHTVRVFSNGRVWETTVILESGESREETVQFTSGRTEILEDVQPGNLFIESDPAGATVFLNQVEQQGKTPLTLNDLRPGIYEIEIVRDLYLPETVTEEVRELDYNPVSVSLTPNFGRVYIDSEPSGALVYINEQQRGTTPLDIARFSAGQYQMRLIQQLYYEEVDTFRVEPDRGFEHMYQLRPQFGSLTVTSTPPRAIVEVDGSRWGETPQTREQVLSGPHVVRVSKENFYEQEQQFEIFDGIHRELPFLLSSSVGYLTIDSEPSEADVTITETGASLGSTPIREIALDPGTYTLRFEMEDYEVEDRTIPVSLAGTPALTIELVRKAGHISVETTPHNANVYLDGEHRGKTPMMLRDVPTGTYTLRLELDGYDTQISTVDVLYNEIRDVRISLGSEGTNEWLAQKKRARILSFIPGGGQLESPNQWWRGVLYLAGVTTAGIMIYEADKNFARAENYYDAALDRYYSSISQYEIDQSFAGAKRAFEDMEKSQQNQNVFLITAGGIYAVSIIDAWLFGGGPKPVSTVTAEASTQWLPFAVVKGNRVDIGVTLQF